MNWSSFLVKAAALTSSLLLVATFVAVRAEVLDLPRRPASEPTTDSNVRIENGSFCLRFDVVGASVSGGPENEFPSTGANDHDWVTGLDRHRQNHALIQVSAEAVQLVADELRNQASERSNAAMMSGSKTLIIPWNLHRNSGPLVAGDRHAPAMLAGSKSRIMDWSPITMFSDGADPLTSIVNPDPRMFKQATAASAVQSSRVQSDR